LHDADQRFKKGFVVDVWELLVFDLKAIKSVF
jgi:hypothetical protein